MAMLGQDVEKNCLFRKLQKDERIPMVCYFF